MPFCPCGSSKELSLCCQPYIENTCLPPSPEALMRSRFTAFCLQNSDYLIKTTAPQQREANNRQQLQATMEKTQWLGLSVLKAQTQGERGEVEFVAYFAERPSATSRLELSAIAEPQQLHEHSRFILEGEQWYYLDGDLLPALKLQRNNPCWCGSGKKLKKCTHG